MTVPRYANTNLSIKFNLLVTYFWLRILNISLTENFSNGKNFN